MRGGYRPIVKMMTLLFDLTAVCAFFCGFCPFAYKNVITGVRPKTFWWAPECLIGRKNSESLHHCSRVYIHDCFSEVCECMCVFLQALEKAKEAGRKERALVRLREQSGNTEHINIDLTYSVSH